MAQVYDFTGNEMSFNDAEMVHNGISLKVTTTPQGDIPVGTFFFQANDGWWGFTEDNCAPSKEQCINGDFIFREYFYVNSQDYASKRWLLARKLTEQSIASEDNCKKTIAYKDLNTILLTKRYRKVDEFYKGIARIHDDRGLWGIIDENGVEIVFPKYASIGKLSEAKNGYVKVESLCSNGVHYGIFDLKSHEIKLIDRKTLTTHFYEPAPLEERKYGSYHYGEYAGSYAQDVVGYSDEIIDDAFDGDPEAYWNID